MKSKMVFCKRCKLCKAFTITGEVMKCCSCGLEKKIDMEVENDT